MRVQIQNWLAVQIQSISKCVILKCSIAGRASVAFKNKRNWKYQSNLEGVESSYVAIWDGL